ncbi:hypothetical protein HanXRQr2_Chr17g0809841 [Helianthus annuus]|uniref:Uncharacterized protein n=1 Tax=Helianthus annuus TaxID=4232 RepID=A0A251RRP2_HELAN|nr:hypothetical protein HanXRQr2_Chr17g0809841 [Helianthus annuus]KAJ0429623.1 hypothetical protein HanHA300_Chr17g0659521 [Helianthus annuus]
MSHHSQPPTSLLSCSPHLPAAGVMFGPTKHVYNPEPPSLTSKLSDRPPPNGGGVRRRTRQKRGERERENRRWWWGSDGKFQWWWRCFW